MAAFSYTALDEKGRSHRGVMEADSARQTREILRKKLLTPLEVQEARSGKRKKDRIFAGRVTLREISILTRQLATMVQSGLPVEQALQP